MTCPTPVFSIIIATHKRASLLSRALTSLRAQTYPHKQIIVISDQHDKATYDVAAESMATGDLFILRHGIAGPSESRNLGMSLITGDYFLFLDDDDTFDVHFLENLANHLPHPSAGNTPSQVFYTNFEIVNELTEAEKITTTQISPVDISAQAATSVFIKNFIPNNCLIFPKKLASEIQFDAAIPYEDWDFILSACGKMPLHHLPVYGPKIHKNDSAESVQRGKSNESSLLNCYLSVYTRHPAPTPQIAAMRTALFSSLGLNLESLLQSVNK